MVERMEDRLREFATSGGSIVMTSHQAVGVVDQVLDLSEYRV